jgi:ribosome biogenesis protein UTP30
VKLPGSEDAMDEDDEGVQEIEACIIVKEESKPWVQELIAKFPSELGCIKKVLGLQSLRVKHKSFTQRRELLARFDVFLADDRILPMLTKALGGKFFDKKKQPIPVALTRKEALPFAVKKCLSSTFMYLSAGTCVTVKAGNTSMSSDKLLANIESICAIVPTKVPRKWSNIRSVSIKTSSSVALPIYNKTPEELEQIQKLAKDRIEAEVKEADAEKKASKKRKVAETPLAKALKKQKAAEEIEKAEADDDIVDEKPKKSAKKKRKESIDDAVEEEVKKVAKTPKSSKKKRKESVDEEAGEEDAAEPKNTAKTPKSSKKKKTESVDEILESKTPKSSKKKKAVDPAEDDAPSTSTKKTPKKATSTDEKFISSKKFRGAKKGYVFKKGMYGCGYYKDDKPVVDKAVLAQFLGKLGRGGGGGGRKSMGGGMKQRKKGGKGRRSY